jgi:hypothetical protein
VRWPSRPISRWVLYYSRLQQQGEIRASSRSSWSRTVGTWSASPHPWDRDKLNCIRTSDEFNRLNLRAALITENLGVVGAQLGERVATQLGVYTEQVEDLT